MHKIILTFLLIALFIAPKARCENPEVSYCLDAAKAFKEKQYDKAYKVSKKTCPTLKKLSRWKQLRYAQGELSFVDYISFVKENQKWPWIEEVRKTAERFLTNDTSPNQVITWFEKQSPKTFKALEIYLSALKKLKKNQQFKNVILREWERMSLSVGQEKILLDLGKGLITKAIHFKRFKNFLMKNKFNIAKRQVNRCAASLQPYLKTRIAFRESKENAVHLYNKLTRVEQKRLDIIEDYFVYLQGKESPFVYPFIRAHRKIFSKEPARFWRLRYIAARDALMKKDYKKVFSALKDHGMTKGDGYVQSQFLLGFVALRFLGDPKLALTYFRSIYSKVVTACSLSKVAYWMAVAYGQNGKIVEQKKWLEKAMEYPQTFYGQKAFKKAGLSLKLSFFRLHYKEQERRSVLKNPYMKLIQLLKSLNSYHDVPPFLYKIYYGLKTNGEKRAFLNYCHREFPEYVYDMARLMGVIYVYRETYRILPETNSAADPAFVNAIIRKESGFNPRAISKAGARGLMQLMPETAKIIAQELGIKMSKKDLTEKPSLNVILGTAYLLKKLDRFQGHKEITLAGYNAGPSNSDKWLKRYGDPRANEIDLLTWIELIPYAETRSYVRRVMANYRVYQELIKAGL